jgi:hypothetical protein
MTPAIYRALLLASLAFGISSVLFDVLVPSALPEVFTHAQEAYDALPERDDSVLLVLIEIVCLVVSTAAVVGLYLFRSWAPRLAVISTPLVMLVTVLMGPVVVSGWGMMLADLSSILWGIVVVLPYLSPLKERFAKPAG